jgi:peptidyl-prolyl cis-trans isomerase SurA
VILSPLRVIALPLFLVVALGACGTGSSNGPTATSTPGGAPTTAAAPSPSAPATLVVTGGSVAAVVNGHSVPMTTYRSLLLLIQRQSAGQAGVTPKSDAQRAMNQVIADEILSEYAAKHHITVSNKEISAQQARDEAQLGGAKGFQQRMTQFGLTIATYKSLVRANILAQKVENKIVPLSKKPVEVAHVRHILIATKPTGKPARTDAAAKALAEQVLSKLQHGQSFASLAKKYSDDTGSAAQGGNLQAICPHLTVPPFDHAAFTLPPHKVKIVHTQFGYHIMEVLSRAKAPPPTQCQQQGAQQRSQKFNTWIQAQIKHANIKKLAKLK